MSATLKKAQPVCYCKAINNREESDCEQTYQSGRDNSLNRGVVGKIEEQAGALHRTGFLEVVPEEPRGLHVHTHGSEHHREVVRMPVERIFQGHERRLAHDLRGDFVVGQAGGREERDLLSSGHGVHDIDGRDSGLDHGLGVVSRGGVDRHTHDIQVVLREHGRRAVDLLSGSVEC